MYRILTEQHESVSEHTDPTEAMRLARRLVRRRGRAFFVVTHDGRHLSTHAPWGKLPEKPVFARMAS